VTELHRIILPYQAKHQETRTVRDGTVVISGHEFRARINTAGEPYDGSLEGQRVTLRIMRDARNLSIVYGYALAYDTIWSYWATDQQWEMDQQEEEKEVPMLINLTPHPIVTRAPDGTEREYPPVGPIARVIEMKDEIGKVDGVPLYRMRYGQVEGLPRPLDGCWMVVSTLVRQALPERRDLISPGELIRDNDGRVIACKAFYTNG